MQTRANVGIYLLQKCHGTFVLSNAELMHAKNSLPKIKFQRNIMIVRLDIRERYISYPKD
jgi:hypothetical protein